MATTEKKGSTLFEVPTTIKVSADFLAGIIVTAIEGGFGSWFPKQRLRANLPTIKDWWSPRRDLPPKDGPMLDTVVATYGEGKDDEIPQCFAARNVAAGGTMTYYEDEDESGIPKDYTVHTLDREKLLKGLSMILTKYPHLARVMGEDEFGGTEYDLDAIGADAVIQCALLGEIKYG